MTEANAECASRAHSAKRLRRCFKALVIVFPCVVQQVTDAEIDGASIFFSKLFRNTEVQTMERLEVDIRKQACTYNVKSWAFYVLEQTGIDTQAIVRVRKTRIDNIG